MLWAIVRWQLGSVLLCVGHVLVRFIMCLYKEIHRIAVGIICEDYGHLKLQDEIPCSEIMKRAKIINKIECILKQKWK